MLKTETDTKEMALRVIRAARKALHRHKLRADFEHGQWWITHLPSGAAWSVCDAEGGPAVDGFDFEQVSEGDRDH